MPTEPIDVLAVAKLPTFLMMPLQQAFTVHDRLHESDPAALDAVAPRIRGVVGSGESKVPAALIERLPALEIVSVMGVGYDGVDVAAAKARGAIVTHTPNVLNDEVADLAIALMLCIARRIPQADAYVRAGHWASKGPMPLARKLSGARLGLVGIGRIAQAIAHRAQAFGMQIAYTARNRRPELPYAYAPTPQQLAAEVDFLCVITPGGAATRKLIGADVLRSLGPNGYLVNVARGSVVDEAALVEALADGSLGGAALDVFENEPNVPEVLRLMDNVVLTPHIGSATTQTRHAMAALAFDNLRAHFAGQRPPCPVPECA